ncbi:heavy-metal-associated domain-containing protein [Thermoleophilia bacterium SCSIO 60948]|nr:heavy-metal-associated domain-containing protein [Thermoleophilia bacterium SCSIO 60948]
MSRRAIATYTVKGMSCSHCATSVSERIESLDPVTEVRVDLPTGRVEVAGSGYTDEQVRQAVEEAGYELIGRAR